MSVINIEMNRHKFCDNNIHAGTDPGGKIQNLDYTIDYPR